MAIVRLAFGWLPENGPEASPPVRATISDSVGYFPDFLTYLLAVLGFAHLAEASNGGKSTPYPFEDTVAIGCKQSPSQWYWRPQPAVSAFTRNARPTDLHLERFPCNNHEPDGQLRLGRLAMLMQNFGQALATNYYERSLPTLKARFGEHQRDWPPVWNFARVVRNSMSHGGHIRFVNANADPVSWRELSYSPSDNDRAILHTDLWPGDLFDLIREMEESLQSPRVETAD